jgi:hypothetical protein
VTGGKSKEIQKKVSYLNLVSKVRTISSLIGGKSKCCQVLTEGKLNKIVAQLGGMTFSTAFTHFSRYIIISLV